MRDSLERVASGAEAIQHRLIGVSHEDLPGGTDGEIAECVGSGRFDFPATLDRTVTESNANEGGDSRVARGVAGDATRWGHRGPEQPPRGVDTDAVHRAHVQLIARPELARQAGHGRG